ncbi:hypothetical protein CL653_03515 [bacterium]|nr:hypothetical protein [bacterium]|tara:strand:- start:253 stop:837 length:585 start_codon:yes stop_codon:yes gene_type:complete
MSYEKIEKAWREVSKRFNPEFKKRVPSLIDLKNLNISKVSENDERIVLMFTSFSEAVSDIEDVPRLKAAIKSWLSRFSTVRIRPTNNQSYTTELIGFDTMHLDEAVVKVFTRKGNKLTPALKCVGGPKHGQRTKDVATCMSPPSYARRTARKVSARKKGAISNKQKINKITNIVSRRRLKKANDRLRKARGGKF